MLTQKPVHKCSQKVHSQQPKPDQLSNDSEWVNKLWFRLCHGRLLSTNQLLLMGSVSSQPHSVCFYSLSSSFLSNLSLLFFHHLVVLSLPALHLSWNEINHLEFQQQEPRAQTYRVFQTHMHETHATPDSV